MSLLLLPHPHPVPLLGQAPCRRAPDGKVDRKALPKPDNDQAANDSAAPGTPTEIALERIWSGALGLSQVRLRDNFFEIGGHSLQAMRVIVEVQKRFGKSLSIGSLFTSPTLLQFSRLLDENARSGAAAFSDGLRGNGTGAPLFLCPG